MLQMRWVDSYVLKIHVIIIRPQYSFVKITSMLVVNNRIWSLLVHLTVTNIMSCASVVTFNWTVREASYIIHPTRYIHSSNKTCTGNNAVSRQRMCHPYTLIDSEYRAYSTRVRLIAGIGLHAVSQLTCLIDVARYVLFTFVALSRATDVPRCNWFICPTIDKGPPADYVTDDRISSCPSNMTYVVGTIALTDKMWQYGYCSFRESTGRATRTVRLYCTSIPLASKARFERFQLPELTARVNGPSWRVTGFHYPSTRPVLTGNGNRSPVNSGR